MCMNSIFTSDRNVLFSSSRSLSFFCKLSRGKKVGVDTLVSLGRTLYTYTQREKIINTIKYETPSSGRRMQQWRCSLERLKKRCIFFFTNHNYKKSLLQHLHKLTCEQKHLTKCCYVRALNSLSLKH